MKMEKIQMVDLQTQYRKISAEIDNAINKVIRSAAFINGPEVAIFRQNLAEWLNTDNAITCGNGTDALQVALMALELEPGDEVITTPFTFIATVEAIALLGLKPVFVDVCPHSFNIDASKIENAITRKTRVILPVHLFGQCADMEVIMEIAGRHNLYVVEDAAQALGSEYTFSKGDVKKAGVMGDIGCTSFFPSKNLGGFGDGGAIFTNIPELAEKITSIIHHGSRVKYYHERIGVNSRLDTIQAAVLDVKLKHLHRYNQSREKAAEYYDLALKGVDQLILPKRMKNSTHIFNIYTLRTIPEQRDPLRESLQSRSVPTMIYYPVPMHLQKGYAYLGYRKGDFPVSESLSESVLSIPMHTELTPGQLGYISNCVSEFYNNL